MPSARIKRGRFSIRSQRHGMRYFSRLVSLVGALVLSMSVAAAGNVVSWANERPTSTTAVSPLAAFSAMSTTGCNSADQYTECISLTPSQGPAGARIQVNGTGWHDHAIRG